LISQRPADAPSFCLDASKAVLNPHNGKVYALAWLDAERLASVSQGGKLQVTDMKDGNSLEFELPTSWVMAVGCSPEGQAIAVGGLDNVVTVYKTDGLKRQPIELRGHVGYIGGVVFQDESLLWSCSGDGAIKEWDLATRQCVRSLEGHEGDVMSLSLSRNRSMLASGSCDETLRIWDTANGLCIKQLTLDSDVNSVSFASDTDTLAACTDDGKLHVFNKDFSKVCEEQVGDEACNAVALSPCGVMAYVGLKSRVMACRVGGGNEPSTKTIAIISKEEKGTMASIAISPDGASLAAGSWDSNVHVLTVRDFFKKMLTNKLSRSECIQRCVAAMATHFDEVRSIGNKEIRLKEGVNAFVASLAVTMFQQKYGNKLWGDESQLTREGFAKAMGEAFQSILPEEKVSEKEFEQWMLNAKGALSKAVPS